MIATSSFLPRRAVLLFASINLAVAQASAATTIFDPSGRPPLLRSLLTLLLGVVLLSTNGCRNSLLEADAFLFFNALYTVSS